MENCPVLRFFSCASGQACYNRVMRVIVQHFLPCRAAAAGHGIAGNILK